MLDGAVEVATPTGQGCLVCREPVAVGDRGFMRVVVAGDTEPGLAPVHVECEALGVVGHDNGVCSCTGFGQDRAAARELWRRLSGERPAGGVLATYTVYRMPPDLPGAPPYGVRAWSISSDGPHRGWVCPAGSLEEARALIPESADVCMVRSPDDDEAIVETWM